MKSASSAMRLRGLYREALEGQKKALGAAHPNTLRSMNNLAVLLKRVRNKYDEAEGLYREAHKGRKKALGVQNPDTLRRSVPRIPTGYDA